MASAYGMGPGGFKVNRPLNDYEQAQHLNIKRRVSDLVHYDQSIIKLNSTFVQYVDMWYGMRGEMALAGAMMSSVLLFGAGAVSYSLLRSGHVDFLVLLIICLLILIMPVKFFLSDAFTYTHYPIRFNRKNRQVYVFDAMAQFSKQAGMSCTIAGPGKLDSGLSDSLA